MSNRNEILEIYAGSVSGGGFPAQIQEIIYYTEQKQKAFSDKTTEISQWYLPDLCMGTSGGNVALYIAISGNFTEGGIKRVVNALSANMFSMTWFPQPMDFVPTWVLGVFEGAVYRPGYGAKTLLKAFNNSENIQTIEMWNSTYNKTTKKTALFCNKSDKDTFISKFTYSPFDFKTMPLKYLDGDIGKISETVIASASVPILFKPVNIDGDLHADGGITYPSPLSPLQEEIYKCIKDITQPSPYETALSNPPIPTPTPAEEASLSEKRNRNILHITYFSPYDTDGSYDDATSTLGTGSIFSAITDASAVKDRYTALNLLERVKNDGQNVEVITSQNNSNLSELLRTYSDTHYFCEIYVRNNNWIDLNKFTPEDILNKMNEAKSQIEFRFFYVE
jgi:predicted acylesterase/phospholipase RssA